MRWVEAVGSQESGRNRGKTFNESSLVYEKYLAISGAPLASCAYPNLLEATAVHVGNQLEVMNILLALSKMNTHLKKIFSVFSCFFFPGLRVSR